MDLLGWWRDHGWMQIVPKHYLEYQLLVAVDTL